MPPTVEQTVNSIIKLGVPGNVPNSPRNQALAAVHAGLRDDTPFGVGSVFEGFMQAELESIGNQTKLNGVEIGVTQGKVDAVKGDTNAIRTNADNTFGGESPTVATAQVWHWVEPSSGENTAITKLSQAEYMSNAYQSLDLHRFYSSCNFLTLIGNFSASEGINDAVVLNDAYEGARLSASETDLEMLSRLYPAYDWQDNYLGLHMTGAAIPSDPTFGPFYVYWYKPLPPSLSDIYHLWDYTPTSGPPKRSGIDDLLVMFGLVPVQW